MKNILNTFFFLIKNLNFFYFKKNNIFINKYIKNFEELKKKGITIIKDYYSKDECDYIVKEILNTFSANKSKVTVTESLDHRLWWFEKYSARANDFLNDKYLKQLIKKYENNDEIFQSTTLAGNIKYKKDGKGSGSGWHRDRTFYKYRYSKAMIYLNDVDLNNGPFQYLEESHKVKNIIRFNYFLKKKYSEKWFNNDEIEFISKKINLNISTVEAKAGDLIIFDGTGVHRGKPLMSGERFSLTNYYRFDPTEKFDF